MQYTAPFLLLVGVLFFAFFVLAYTWEAPVEEKFSEWIPVRHWRGISGYTALAVVAAITYPGSEIRFDLLNSVILINFSWVLLTLTWATDRWLSLRRVTQGAVVGALALSVSMAYPFDNRVMLIAVCTAAFVVWGVIRGIRRSEFPHPVTGRFGVAGMSGKGGPIRQGMNCVMFTMSMAYLVQAGRIPDVLGVCLIIIALLLLFLTRSRTPVWAGFVSLLIWLGVVWINHPGSLTWFLIAMPFLYIGSGLAIVFLPLSKPGVKKGRAGHSGISLTLNLERDPEAARTFTNRTHYWRYILAETQSPLRRLLGFGHGSFWTELRSLHIARQTGWNSHSMYFELLADSDAMIPR